MLEGAETPQAVHAAEVYVEDLVGICQKTLAKDDVPSEVKEQASEFATQVASAIWAAYMNLWERRQREIAEDAVGKGGRPKKETVTGSDSFRSGAERMADSRFYERMGKLKETGRMLVGERVRDRKKPQLPDDAIRRVLRMGRDEAAMEPRFGHDAAPWEPRLIHSEIAHLADHVDEGSVDLILVDPPYPKQYRHLWGELAEFAIHALADDGILVAMSGVACYDAAMDMRAYGLVYRWTVNYAMPGKNNRLFHPRVFNSWKPVVVMTKDAKAWPEYHVRDVIDGVPPDDEKERHVWAQADIGMLRLAEQFVHAGQHICDPMIGGGSSGIAARLLGCSFTGADKDKETLEIARSVLA